MTLHSWLASSSVRHYPGTPTCRRASLTIEAALNERFSFQAVVRAAELDGNPRRIDVEVDAPAGWQVRVRRVGYVPMPHLNTAAGMNDPIDVDGLGHIPGYVPDPLFDETSLLLPVQETHAFWITVQPGRAAVPGPHRLTVTVRPEQGAAKTHTVAVKLHDFVIRKRRGFHVTHWFYVDALIDWYRTDLFDRRFWHVLPDYVRNMVEHGQDTLYVPTFTPPLDGVKRPSQLLRVEKQGKDRYRFDWRDVRRYVKLAKQCGIDRFEWCHPFTQWGAKEAIRVYEGQGRDERLLWPPATGATSPTYRAFLRQYLEQLHRFLTREGLLKRSFFHVSDEPHGEEHRSRYRAARAMLRELAPWMSVMDALSEPEFAREGLTDMPVPSISVAPDFAAEGMPCWCYYCCGPRGPFLNRHMDTPLPKIAMHGFLFYRWPFRGFLHWGYNYWYESQTRDLIDPYTVLDGRAWPGWAYGDTSVVYPGPDGPVDSMRWEVFAEGLRDYALLQTAGIDPGSALFAPIKSFADFPKDPAWRRRARSRILARA